MINTFSIQGVTFMWTGIHCTRKRPFYLLFKDKHHIFSLKITKPELTTYTIGQLGHWGNFEPRGWGQILPLIDVSLMWAELSIALTKGSISLGNWKELMHTLCGFSWNQDCFVQQWNFYIFTYHLYYALARRQLFSK